MLNIIFFILFKIFYCQDVNIDIQGRQFALTYLKVGSSLIEMPVILTTYGYLAFYKHFDGYLYSRLIELIIPEPFIYQTSLIVVGIGILVGMIGSASAVRKYLKV